MAILMKIKLMVLVLCLGATAAARGAAHEVTPAIAGLKTDQGEAVLEIRVMLEAFIAGIDLDGLSDTSASDRAGDYTGLRALPPDALRPMAEVFVQEWLEDLTVTAAGEPVLLEVTAIRIPETGDITQPRYSDLQFRGRLPEGARHLVLHWPAGSGSAMVRQRGVAQAYAGYLLGGQSTPPVPLNGGSAMSPAEAFLAYLPAGFAHVLPKGWDHILFVLALFFLSPRAGPLLLQIFTFTVAHTATLALATLNIVTLSPAVAEPLIAAAIVYAGVTNIFARQLHADRILLVLAVGLLHGLGFAAGLAEAGLADGQFLMALLGYNTGVELGQIAVIAAAFLTLGLRFRGSLKYRGRVAIPASVTIAAIGSYWLAERIFL